MENFCLGLLQGSVFQIWFPLKRQTKNQACFLSTDNRKETTILWHSESCQRLSLKQFLHIKSTHQSTANQQAHTTLCVNLKKNPNCLKSLAPQISFLKLVYLQSNLTSPGGCNRLAPFWHTAPWSLHSRLHFKQGQTMLPPLQVLCWPLPEALKPNRDPRHHRRDYQNRSSC